MFSKKNTYMRTMKRGTKVQHFGIRKFNVGVASVAIAAGIFFGSDAVLASAEAEMQPGQEEVSGMVEGGTSELPDLPLEDLPPVDTQTPEPTSFQEDTSQVKGVVEDEIVADQLESGQKEEQEQRPADSSDSETNKELDVADIEMQAVNAEEPEVSDKPFDGQMGVKDASENTFAEELGETGRGYNFQNLQFNPENLDKSNDTNEAGFEMLAQHNVAASTSNWVVNLQIDERLAQYITKIDVNADNGRTRRVLVRKNDNLGRSTNIWQVNYIRASEGLFAGGWTLGPTAAEDGIIHFEKPVNEILAEIGDDKLTSDKLLYRVYLTSKKDDGKIVSGIDTTGYFRVNGIDDYDPGEISESNKDVYKHAGVEARVITNHEKITQDGKRVDAIVVDQKLTKNGSFYYGINAKDKPWNINFKADPRLVKYIDGIELHYLGSATSVQPGFGIDDRSNYKVADLAIERREGHPNYGVGSYTDNDFTNIVNMDNTSYRPNFSRVVYKLNKPLNEILEELKEEAGVAEGKPFGDDFLFSAWFTDANDKLIPNSDGTGVYQLQDIDGDGKADEIEANQGTSPFIGEPTLNAPFEGDTVVTGQVHLHELAGSGNTVELVNQAGEVIATTTVDAVDEKGQPFTGVQDIGFNIPEGKSVGNAGEDLTVRVIPSDERYQNPEMFTTKVKEAPKAVEKPIEVEQDTDLTQDADSAKNAIENNAEMPEGTTFEWKEAPDTSAVGQTTGTVVVTIPNRDQPFEIEVPINVTEKVAEETVTPEFAEEITTTLGKLPDAEIAIENFDSLPKGSVAGWSKNPTINEVGQSTGTVTVVTPDGKMFEEEVLVNVIEVPKAVNTPIEVEQGHDLTQDVDSAKEAIENNASMPDGTTFEWKESPNTSTVGETTGTVVVTVPGIEEPFEVDVPINVVEKEVEEPFEPVFKDEIDTTIGKVPNAEEVVENFVDLPEGTKAGWSVTPDVSAEGTVTGTVIVATPEGEVVEHEVTVNVTDNRDYAEKVTPEIPTEKTPVMDENNLTDAEKEEVKNKVVESNKDIFPEGTDVVVGDNGDTTITYPDNSVDTIPGTDLVVEMTDAEKYTPETDVTDTDLNVVPDAEDLITNKDDLPADAEYIWREQPNVSEIGESTGSVLVVYPDGTTDTVDVTVNVVDNRSDDEKYDANIPAEKTPVDDVTNLTDAEKEEVKNKVEEANRDNFPENTEIEVGNNGDTTITYPDQSTEVIPGEDLVVQKSDADKYTPNFQDVETELGEVPSAKDAIENFDELPEGTKVVWEETPNVDTKGTTTGNVIVIYPDESMEEQEVTITVTDSRTDAEKTMPEVPAEKTPVVDENNLTDAEKEEVKNKVEEANKDNFPEGTDVEVGNNGDVTITYPDNSTDIIPGKDLVTPMTDAEIYTPEANNDLETEINVVPNAEDAIVNKDDLPEGTDFLWKEEPNVSQEGTSTGTVLVVYPDGTTDQVEVDVNVVDNREDVLIHNDVNQPIPEGYDRVIFNSGEGVEDFTTVVIDIKKHTVVTADQINIPELVALEGYENAHWVTEDNAIPVGAMFRAAAEGQMEISVQDILDMISNRDGTGQVTVITGVADKVETPDNEKYEPILPGDKVEVEDKDNLTQAEKDEVKNNVQESNKDNFPEGTDIEVGNNGDTTITYPDGTTDIIPGGDLIVEKPAISVEHFGHIVQVDENGNIIKELYDFADESEANIYDALNTHLGYLKEDGFQIIDYSRVVDENGSVTWVYEVRKAQEDSQDEDIQVEHVGHIVEVDHDGNVIRELYDFFDMEEANIYDALNTHLGYLKEDGYVVYDYKRVVDEETGQVTWVYQVVKVDSQDTETPDKPGVEKPETDKPGTEKPETDKPETETPETDKPGTDKPETDKPEAEAPEIDKPGTNKPEAEAPETDKPGTDKPETEAPETDKPEAESPELDKSEAGQVEADKSTAQDTQATDSDKAGVLPETGEADNAALLGTAAMSVLAGLGLVARRRKED